MAAVMVTGASGFFGGWLCRRIADEHDVIPVNRDDVSGSNSLAGVVENARPQVVVHTAFVNRKPKGWDERRYLDHVTEINLPFFQACAVAGVRLILISSSSVYGNESPGDLLDETKPLVPVSLYGVAKLLQESLARYTAATSGLEAMIIRPFNLIGPGQKEGMLFPDWVAKARAVINGEAGEMRVKTIGAARDFVDVRDAADAVALLINNFQAEEVVNIASGEAVALESVLEELRNLTNHPLQVMLEGSASAGNDLLSQRGSSKKLETEWGWRRKRNWRISLGDLWNEHRDQNI